MFFICSLKFNRKERKGLRRVRNVFKAVFFNLLLFFHHDKKSFQSFNLRLKYIEAVKKFLTGFKNLLG